MVLRSAGTNCDKETAFAFFKAGAAVELEHINQLKAKEKRIADYHILALAGGFSYGDDIAAGKILANELKYALVEELKAFINQGKLIIGICNGFQVLVKAGFLPGNEKLDQEVTLTINDSAKFEDKWVYLQTANCVWTKDLPETIYLPIAHGEGKFMAKDKGVLERLENNGQVVLRYRDNPNGSQNDIAGLCDKTGRVFGLMPHPERHSFGWQNPHWTRDGLKKEGDGLKIFRNGVEYAKKNL